MIIFFLVRVCYMKSLSEQFINSFTELKNNHVFRILIQLACELATKSDINPEARPCRETSMAHVSTSY